MVPTELFVGFDVRITPTLSLEEFEEMMKGWFKEAGDGITCEYRRQVCYDFFFFGGGGGRGGDCHLR